MSFVFRHQSQTEAESDRAQRGQKAFTLRVAGLAPRWRRQCSPAVLSELRLMSSHCFDSQMLLCVILAGDDRLTEKLRCDELVPLGTRIRMRLALEPSTPEELPACLDHLLEAAGNSALMTEELKKALSDLSLSNPRALMNTCSELLLAAAKQDLPQLDEKHYMQLTAASQPAGKRRATIKASS